ncbi:hypothetical protein, partial [Pseudomonas sp.]|uniref:hypothetical protein n=1 Tax=Pseudomonas sp. TaxID=306 RepID=UPI003CC67572
LLHRALAPRDEFVDTQLAQRLQADFGVQPEHLVIDVPATVSAVKQLIGGSGAPGTPSRLVHTPSERREQLALAELALWGTDEVMAARLRFGHVLGHGLGVATTLPSVAQLCALMAELDLPAQYEQCLRQAFTGLAQEDVAQLRLRRATLLAPWQAGLRLQGRLAQLGGRLDEASLVLLHNPEAAMHWVQFRPGRGPDGSSQAVSLSGVILLQAAGSPLTLLYLPDAPNGKVLTRHQGLAQACAGLARMASDTGMTAYLASLPLVGDVAEHEGHIRQALLNGYEGFVAPGQRVQTAATLAEHQLNLQLGRLIARHRATARSQDQLWLAAAAQGHGQVFVIIKMLVGLVPFVGTAVGLYDAFDSAMNAVDAWRRGRPGDSLDEMENMLVALIGAAMDVLPTMTAGLHVRSGMHRARAARGLPAPEPATVSGSAFHGYQSHVAVTSLREGSDGVCRLGEAQYILRGGLAYEVQWDAAYRTWRLKGSAHKTYRQPVVRGVDGQWRSHGAAYGHLVDGGLAGGGATATRLADAMVDRLPLAVQRRLPRWLGDALVREERRIFSRLLTEEREVTRLLRATEQVRSQYATQLHNESLRLDVVRLGIEEVQACDQLLASLVAQRGRIDSRVYRDAFQATRYQAMGRMQTLVRLGKDRLRSLSFEYTELQAAQHRLVVAIEGGEGDFTEFTRHTLAYLKRGRVMREAMLEQAEFIEHWSIRFEDQWHGASLDAPRRADIERIMSESDYRYQPRLHQVIKAETLLKLVFNENLSGSPERLELARLFARDVRALNSLLSTWRDMGEVSHLSQAHRRRILDQFVGEMEHFRWRLEEWTTAYPEHVDLRSQKRVLRQLKVLTDMAQAEVSRGNVSLRREQPEGGPRKRVFETVDD